MCWSCVGDNHRHSRPLHIKTPFLAQHDSQHVVYLHSPQTGVCPPCARTLGSLITTLSIVVRLCSPQTRVCPLRAEVPSWIQPSVLPSVASQEFFFSPCTILSIAICLHSPQTAVCLLCVKTCILLGMTLDVAFRLRSHQTRVCPLYAGACPARPST